MRYFTIKDASKILGLNYQTVAALVRKFELNNQRFGGVIMLTEQDIEALDARPTRKSRRSRNYDRG